MPLTKDNILDELLKIYPKGKEDEDDLNLAFVFFTIDLIDAIKSNDQLKVQTYFNFINQLSELNDDWEIDGYLEIIFSDLHAALAEGDLFKDLSGDPRLNNLSEHSRKLFDETIESLASMKTGEAKDLGFTFYVFSGIGRQGPNNR